MGYTQRRLLYSRISSQLQGPPLFTPGCPPHPCTERGSCHSRSFLASVPQSSGTTEPESSPHPSSTWGSCPQGTPSTPPSAVRYESTGQDSILVVLFLHCVSLGQLPFLSEPRFKLSEMGIFLAPQDIVRSLRGHVPGNGTG